MLACALWSVGSLDGWCEGVGDYCVGVMLMCGVVLVMLQAIEPNGREVALRRGCNVLMPILTPTK